jgi:hypothetical protein
MVLQFTVGMDYVHEINQIYTGIGAIDRFVRNG